MQQALWGKQNTRLIIKGGRLGLPRVIRNINSRNSNNLKLNLNLNLNLSCTISSTMQHRYRPFKNNLHNSGGPKFV